MTDENTKTSVSLNEYLKARVYFHDETFTQNEVRQEILNNPLFYIESSLESITNVRDNVLYLIPNNKNISKNLYDIYLHKDNKWEQIDSLEFNISDYCTTSEMENKVNEAITTHGHYVVNPEVGNQYNGFMSVEDKIKLDTYPDTYVIDNELANTDNPVKNRVVKTAIDGKAPKNHKSSTDTYGLSDTTNYGHSKSSNTMPLMDDGNGSIGTQTTTFARADHVHPTDTTRASNTVATIGNPGLMSAQQVIDLEALKNIVQSINFSDYTTNEDVQQAIANWDFGFTAIETSMSDTSINPVQNKVIKKYVDDSLTDNVDKGNFLEQFNQVITDMNNIT